jgi:hypothetical protein
MFKQLLLRKMLAAKLKGVPQEQQDMILGALEKDPDLFMRLAKEVEEKTKSGMSQMDAAQKVFTAHQDELKKVLGQQ